MLFMPHKKCVSSLENKTLTINCTNISRVAYTKFLGVTIDDKLNWGDHINIIGNKICRNIGILKYGKRYLPNYCIKNLYCTLILPYLTYCNMIWITACKYRIDRLKKLQKRAISLFSKQPDAFKQENILKLEDIGTIQLLQFVKNIKMGVAPPQFTSLFTNVLEIHHHNTRRTHHY